MFGIFFIGVLTGAFVCGKAADVISNSFKRTEASSQDSVTYLDRHNKTRLVSNNKRVMYGWKDGRHVIMDPASGNVYYDLDAVKEKEAEKRAIVEGETVINCYSPISQGDVKYYRSSSDLLQYKSSRGNPRDIRTGRRLSVILVNRREFYLDMKSGELLRLSDRQKFKDIKEKDDDPYYWSYRYADDQGIITDEEIIRSYNIYHKRLGEQLENAFRRDETKLFLHYTSKDVLVDRYGNGETIPLGDDWYGREVLKLKEVKREV